MMQTMKVRSRIGKNGIIEIQLPPETEGEELDIVVFLYNSVNCGKKHKIK